nr:hypothetical protein [Nostoc sp. DedSLP01]
MQSLERNLREIESDRSSLLGDRHFKIKHPTNCCRTGRSTKASYQKVAFTNVYKFW